MLPSRLYVPCNSTLTTLHPTPRPRNTPSHSLHPTHSIPLTPSHSPHPTNSKPSLGTPSHHILYNTVTHHPSKQTPPTKSLHPNRIATSTFIYATRSPHLSNISSWRRVARLLMPLPSSPSGKSSSSQRPRRSTPTEVSSSFASVPHNTHSATPRHIGVPGGQIYPRCTRRVGWTGEKGASRVSGGGGMSVEFRDE
ncbi:hypothetical protein N658DRAFT_180279 [Parathielavia hyrcaniae]|uniref:Uncharacterized protein n=1 Tax=Parathielavia hyrcaniae TaxID=113614 RepID=A0AAN6QBN4_9PEZI|nr:hypothetical protein N658DRAFT_180279 [Parathielavia hyrcaniae]